MQKILVLGLMFGTIAAWNAGCSGDDDDDGHAAPVSIAITGGTAVTIGSNLQLTAIATFDDASIEDITNESTWMTNSAGVATVGAATGLVTGNSAGVATISVTHDDVVGTTSMTSSTAINATLTFTGSGWPHDTFNAFVRILENGVVKGCIESAPIAGSAFSVTIPNLRVGHTYTYETFADLDSDNLHDDELATDHQWTGTIIVTTPAFTKDVPHGDLQSVLTWAPDVGCPG